MTKELVESLLRHHGVKGMKWNVRRSPDEIKADAKNGVNAVGEALEDAGDEIMGNESITEELGDVIDVLLGGKGNLKKETAQLKDAVKDKLEDVSKDIKERGKNILINIFGESKPKKQVTFLNTKVTVKHHGVKGQKWGVRRDRPTIKQHIKSLQRERQWKNVLKEVDNLTTQEITTVSKRIGLENDLKTLSRKKSITTQADKNAYTFRANLSDTELSSRVTRLRAKDSLTKNVSSASKEQREIGEKVVNVSKAIALQYAASQTRPSAQDIFNAYNNPKQVKDKAVKELVSSITKGAK